MEANDEQLTLKNFTKDVPNITKNFTPGQGTIIQVPIAETAEADKLFHEALKSGIIDASKVNSAQVCQLLLRPYVNHECTQASATNGYRPNSIDIAMNERVAHLATNVSSVKRTQRTWKTIGGVETPKQYNEGSNQLLRVIKRGGYVKFHEVIGAVHEYAINDNNRSAREAAKTSLETKAQELRTELCDALGLPPDTQVELQNKNATIQRLQDSLARKTTKLGDYQEKIEDQLRSIGRKEGIIQKMQEEIDSLKKQPEEDDEYDEHEDGEYGEDCQHADKKRKTNEVTPLKLNGDTEMSD